MFKGVFRVGVAVTLTNDLLVDEETVGNAVDVCERTTILVQLRNSDFIFQINRFTFEEIPGELARLLAVGFDSLLRMDSLRRVDADETNSGLLAVDEYDNRVAVHHAHHFISLVGSDVLCGQNSILC